MKFTLVFLIHLIGVNVVKFIPNISLIYLLSATLGILGAYIMRGNS